MIYYLKKKKNFKDFHYYLIKQNRHYDFFRNELYFTLFYRKNAVLNALAAFLRDFFILIGFRKNINTREFFFFTLPTQSGYKVFENLNFFSEKKLLKIPSKKNKYIKSKSLYFYPTFEFINSFFSTLKLLNIKKNHGLLICIYVLRLALIINVWKFYLEKNNYKSIKIYLHNDFDIYNAALLFAIKYNLIKKKVIPICFQHGIPTDEFFPTKSPIYLLWSKKMLNLFKKNNPKNHLTKFKIVKNNFLNRNQIKREKKFIIDDKIYFISQGHTKIYGENTNKYLINFFNNLSENYSNTHCLLHPSENKSKNVYNEKYINNIHNYPHNFLKKNKIKVFVCFCSTAMLDIMKNGNIVIGINTSVDQSKLTYKYFTPPLNVKTSKELLNLFKKLKNNKFLIKRALFLQSKYLNKIYN